MRANVLRGWLLAVFCLPVAVSAAEIQRWQAADGAQVLLSERHELPIVDVAVIFKGAGSAADPAGKDNTASAAAQMVMRGTPSLNEEAFAARVNDLGANLSGSASLEYATFGFRSLSEPAKLNGAVTLFKEALAQPRFDENVLQRIKDRAALALKQSESYPDFVADRALTALNYPDHPYGKSARQTPEKIQAVSSADLREFHRRHYARNNAVVLVVGDVGRERAGQLADEILAVLPARVSGSSEVPPVNVKGGQFRHIPFPHSQQTQINLGLPVLKADDPDYFAMLVGNYILGGGGFDSRLMKVLRDRHGYTYGASSSLSAYGQAAPFTIEFGTENKNSRAALAAAQKVLADFVVQGPQEDELKQAKAYLTGSFPLRFDTNAKMIGNLASVAVYNRPDNWFDTFNDKINALSAADIKRAWQKHIRPQDMNIVVTGGEPFKP